MKEEAKVEETTEAEGGEDEAWRRSRGAFLFMTCSLMRSGQIIATSHDRFPPNGGLVRGIPGYFREI